MNEDLIQRAHRAYDLEGDYLERLLASDPTYAGLHHRLERAEALLSQGRDPEQARAVREARSLLLRITRETAFKVGYLLAHTPPPDEPGQ
ncbi:MAG: hypothetical protein V1797_16610 [Pseudomonadota bacterium]